MTLRSGMLRYLASIIIMGFALFTYGGPSKADPSPIDTLLGSWGGSGEILLDRGRRERIKCNAYYTGGGSQLGLAIRCAAESSRIEIRSKLTYSGGRLSGQWEERTYNASGSASGTATSNTIRLSIRGGVSGTMVVSFTKSRQNVTISTQGTALQGVRITLSRS